MEATGIGIGYLLIWVSVAVLLIGSLAAIIYLGLRALGRTSAKELAEEPDEGPEEGEAL